MCSLQHVYICVYRVRGPCLGICGATLAGSTALQRTVCSPSNQDNCRRGPRPGKKRTIMFSLCRNENYSQICELANIEGDSQIALLRLD